MKHIFRVLQRNDHLILKCVKEKSSETKIELNECSVGERAKV